MWMLVSGLALFFLAHLIPTFPDVRARLVGMIGRGRMPACSRLFRLVSLVLIVWGYGATQGLGRANPQLWVSPAWMRHVTMALMLRRH